MLTHTWIEQLKAQNANNEVLSEIRSAVQFDCGEVDSIPVGKGREFCEARAPFPNTLLQFETPSSPAGSHAIVLWREQSDGSIFLIAAQRGRDKTWRTCGLTRVNRLGDEHHYERIGFDASNSEYVTLMHARAMNLFYILGCSNVTTVDHVAPVALNKKRARSGKLPILSYKTLVIALDQAKKESSAMGGTHSSPRVHLRRGHIRKLPSEERVWVQSCVVGSKHGMVSKDYKVTTMKSVQAGKSKA